MNAEEIYMKQVLDRIPPGPLREQIALDLRSHIAERVERGHTLEEALRQLGDPKTLAESYMMSVPLVAAPFGRRIAAKLVDVAIVLLAPCIVLFGGLALDPTLWSEPIHVPFFLLIFLALTMAILYPMLSEADSGQTVGKRMFGLRVVTESGTRISLGQAIVRYLPSFLEIAWIDVLFVFFNEKRQRGFELISKTRVIDAREPVASAHEPAHASG